MIPAPTVIGVFGIMRMTGYAPPESLWIVSQVSPAAIVTSTKRSPRDANTGESAERTSGIICGLTARKIRSHVFAISSFVETRAESSAASRSAFSRVRLERTGGFSGCAFLISRATALPIAPVPMIPIESNIRFTPFYPQDGRNASGYGSSRPDSCRGTSGDRPRRKRSF